jgi:hypothetical protein
MPELTVAVKRRVDRERRPGMFLLTGSSRLGRAALGGSDPLAGRSVRVRLWPMTQSELVGAPVNVLGALLAGSLAPKLQTTSKRRRSARSTTADGTTHRDLLARVRRGGLPSLALLPMEDALRSSFFAEYVEAVVAHETEGRHDRSELIRLARYLQASTSRLLQRASCEPRNRASPAPDPRVSVPRSPASRPPPTRAQGSHCPPKGPCDRHWAGRMGSPDRHPCSSRRCTGRSRGDLCRE